jgi:hypothetical protein
MDALRANPGATDVLAAIDHYLSIYGHMGYTLDFVEPPQVEDPAGLFTTLRNMVGQADYNPNQAADRAADIRGAKFEEVKALLLEKDELYYWQFQHRLWLARRYNYAREEVAFLFGYCTSVLRPIAFELNRRLRQVGTFQGEDDVFYCVTSELNEAIAARKEGKAVGGLGDLAAQRRALRETQKQHHPPGTVPEEARQNDGLRFKVRSCATARQRSACSKQAVAHMSGSS